MPLHLALLQTVTEHPHTIDYTVQLLNTGETREAKRSSPVTNLNLFPQPGQLVAVDDTISPLEIVHLYESVDPTTLTPADRAALEQDTFPTILARHTPPEQQFFARRRYRLIRNGQVIHEEIFPSHERVYGKYEIQMMLELTGFRDVQIYDGWMNQEPFAGKHDVMVIHGRKP